MSEFKVQAGDPMRPPAICPRCSSTEFALSNPAGRELVCVECNAGVRYDWVRCLWVWTRQA